VDSNHRPSGYEPDELPLLHAAPPALSVEFSVVSAEFNSTLSTQYSQLHSTLSTQNSQLHEVVGARTYSPSGPPASTFGAAVFHDPVRDGSGWGHRAPRTPLVQRRCDPFTWRFRAQLLLCQGFSQGSPRPCAPLASTCHHASSCGRLPRYLRGGLPVQDSEGPHLGAHFPLRCFQRFLLPDIATQPAIRITTAPPAVRPRRSSRTERSSPQDPKRP
jgi:hypothetical protein